MKEQISITNSFSKYFGPHSLGWIIPHYGCYIHVPSLGGWLGLLHRMTVSEQSNFLRVGQVPPGQAFQETESGDCHFLKAKPRKWHIFFCSIIFYYSEKSYRPLNFNGRRNRPHLLMKGVSKNLRLFMIGHRIQAYFFPYG